MSWNLLEHWSKPQSLKSLQKRVPCIEDFFPFNQRGRFVVDWCVARYRSARNSKSKTKQK